jgi:hypothetical protein
VGVKLATVRLEKSAEGILVAAARRIECALLLGMGGRGGGGHYEP